MTPTQHELTGGVAASGGWTLRSAACCETADSATDRWLVRGSAPCFRNGALVQGRGCEAGWGIRPCQFRAGSLLGSVRLTTAGDAGSSPALCNVQSMLTSQAHRFSSYRSPIMNDTTAFSSGPRLTNLDGIGAEVALRDILCQALLSSNLPRLLLTV